MAAQRASTSQAPLVGVLLTIALVFAVGRYLVQRPSTVRDDFLAADLVVIPDLPLGPDAPAPVARDASTWDLGGQVGAPAGAPPDPGLRVVARRRPPTEAAHLSEGDEYRAAVASDGSFRLVLPTSWERAWIDLAGTHLFLDEPLELRRGVIGLELVLRARLGGHVRGNITLADGSTPPLTGRSLVRVQPERGATGLGSRGFDVRPDAEGQFELCGLPAQTTFHVAPVYEGSAPAAPQAVRLTGGASQVLDFELPAGERVAGRVTDATGTPLAGARVIYRGDLSKDGGPELSGSWGLEDVTDAQGTFKLQGLPRGTRHLTVELTGYVLPEPLRLELGADAERVDLEVRLQAGRQIAGHVRWPDGTPGVELALELRRGQRAPRRLKTDAEGRFEARDLQEGTFELFVTGWRRRPDGADEWGYQRVAGVSPGGGELAVTLEGGLRVGGLVTNGAGDALRSFRVEATPVDVVGDPPTVVRDVNSPKGTFTLAGLPAGQWELFVSAAGFASPAPVALELPRAKDAPPLDFALEALGRVTGRVLAPDGTPLAGAEVRPRSVDGGPGDVLETVRTDAFGRFHLAEVPPGQWELSARANDLAESDFLPIEIPRGGDLTDVLLVLREGARVAGEVFDESGSPAVGWLVSLVQEDLRHHHTGRTDDAGQFLFENLIPGSWKLVALSPGQAGASAPRREEQLLELAEGAELDVHLGALAALQDPVAAPPPTPEAAAESPREP